MKSINDIKTEYSLIDNFTAGEFIRKYSEDTRSGVVSLVKKAEKIISDYEKEIVRTDVMYSYENEYCSFTAICGIDEVGRGPLAGPVVAGAVILPKDDKILYLNDSKKLSAKKREELSDIIMERAISVSIAEVSHERIDEINILQATYEAMRKAVHNLSVSPDILLNDAVTIPGLSMKQVPIIKGDAKSASIAAASIVAKVYRDRLMVEYDKLYPGYGFGENKGYGSQAHINAIKSLGPSPIHRMSFIGNFI